MPHIALELLLYRYRTKHSDDPPTIRSGLCRQSTAIDGAEPLDEGFDLEFLVVDFSRFKLHARKFHALRYQALKGGGESGAGRRDQHAVAAVLHDLLDLADLGGDEGGTCAGAFDQRHRHRVGARRKNDDVGVEESALDLLGFKPFDKINQVVAARLGNALLERPGISISRDHAAPRPGSRRKPDERINENIDPLAVTDLANEQQPDTLVALFR